MENTFTYTARSTDNPDKMATFTLQNGSVNVQLGNALMEQVERAFDAFQEEEEAKNQFQSLIEPTATGAVQKILQPIPVQDFDADLKGDALQTMAWIRAGGLRLAPVMVTWNNVDNPSGAQAFVKEINNRKEQVADGDNKLFDPFDYWATWLVVTVISVLLPVFWWKKWQQQRSATG